MHDVAKAFYRAFQISGLSIAYTRGYNPMPRIELSPPLPLGVEGENEILIAWINISQDNISQINRLFSLLAKIDYFFIIRHGFSSGHSPSYRNLNWRPEEYLKNNSF